METAFDEKADAKLIRGPNSIITWLLGEEEEEEDEKALDSKRSFVFSKVSANSHSKIDT
jgi:hypothetical protein